MFEGIIRSRVIVRSTAQIVKCMYAFAESAKLRLHFLASLTRALPNSVIFAFILIIINNHPPM